MKIGVISDTHNFLDPKIHELFAGVDHILHAGDIGNATIISELEGIAPVTAVYGNTDTGLPFKETEVIELDTRRFLIHHIVNPHAPDERVKERIARAQSQVVVFGHTHRTFCESIGGVLYFNPGSAGKPKFGLGRTVAILDCDAKEIRHEFINL
jgi:putative phosphoesterase